MMFKVIPMPSKPLKQVKYNEILRNTSKKHVFSKHISVLTCCPKFKCAPKLINRQNGFFDVFYNLHNPKPLTKFKHMSF